MSFHVELFFLGSTLIVASALNFAEKKYLEKKRADADKRAKQEAAYHQYHRACGHINMKNLII